MKIGIEILALLSPAGFEKRFHKNCKLAKTNEEAYEITEKEYEAHFMKRRYASYDSFRVTKNKKIRNNAPL
jgi:hypothetical protein